MDRFFLRSIAPYLILAGVVVVLYTQSPRKAESPEPTLHVQIEEKPSATSTQQEVAADDVVQTSFQYIEIIDSCSAYFEGVCVNMRSGPSAEHPVVSKLRSGTIFKVARVVESDGQKWYQIEHDAHIRYRERVQDEWFVSGEFARVFWNEGDIELSEGTHATTSKEIIVDRSDQMLYAYNGSELYMELSISTGLEMSPTPRGTFTVYKKTPSRYMQGPLPGVSTQYYDLPGVPWNLYFTLQGGVIHGAYWHDRFGQRWSHGCVNLPVAEAEKLYSWTPVGTKVTVRD